MGVRFRNYSDKKDFSKRDRNQKIIMSGSKWLADKALAQLRNVPRLTVNNIQSVGRKPVRRPRGKTRGYDYSDNKSVAPLDRRNRRPALGYEHMIVPKVYKVQ